TSAGSALSRSSVPVSLFASPPGPRAPAARSAEPDGSPNPPQGARAQARQRAPESRTRFFAFPDRFPVLAIGRARGRRQEHRAVFPRDRRSDSPRFLSPRRTGSPSDRLRRRRYRKLSGVRSP